MTPMTPSGAYQVLEEFYQFCGTFDELDATGKAEIRHARSAIDGLPVEHPTRRAVEICRMISGRRWIGLSGYDRDATDAEMKERAAKHARGLLAELDALGFSTTLFGMPS